MRTDDYLSAGEDLRRRELVWGVVREPPSPFAPHQRVTTRIAALLDAHVRGRHRSVNTDGIDVRGSEPVRSAVLPQFPHTAAELLDDGRRPDSI